MENYAKKKYIYDPVHSIFFKIVKRHITESECVFYILLSSDDAGSWVLILAVLEGNPE